MALYCLDLMISRKPPIAIHDECDMMWYRALSQGTDEKFSEL
jgi:hypothetical protein